MQVSSKLTEEVGRLADLPRPDLVERWRAIYGTPPPRGIKRPLLERAIAFHIQAKAWGGISAGQLRVLRSALPRSAAQVGSEVQEALSSPEPKSKLPRALALPGTRLVRDWHGRTHIVDLTPKGVLWNGRSFSSLSAVARAITGTRWSGPRFFGLGLRQ